MPSLLLLCLCLFSFVRSFDQSVGVKIRLICEEEEEGNKQILLYTSEDTLKENEMTNVTTNGEGEVTITGSADLPRKMKPVLVFQNKCGIDNESECYNILTIVIPDEYVFRGEIEEFYEVGTVNLANSIFPKHFILSKVCP